MAAKPDTELPLGWAVFWNGRWTPVPGGVRATSCEDGANGIPKPVGDYPSHPIGRAVIWVYPEGVIRCFSPPAAGG